MSGPNYRRHSLRLPKYDYSTSGAYFITLCGHHKKCVFGDVVEDKTQLNELGNIVAECWRAIPAHFPVVHLDSFVVMPNHFHGILIFGRGEACLAPTGDRKQKSSLGNVIGSFKSAVSKRFHESHEAWAGPVWQHNDYEHVIRGEDDLNKIREYIANNPLQWALDEENPENVERFPGGGSKTRPYAKSGNSKKDLS